MNQIFKQKMFTVHVVKPKTLLTLFLPLFLIIQTGPALAQKASLKSPASTSTQAAKKQKPVIAIFKFEAYGVDPKIPNIMTEMLQGEMSQLTNYQIIGAKEVDAMLDYEQKKQMAGCTDTQCLVMLGGALGAEKIIIGTIGKLGNSYTITTKLVNIQMGRVESIYTKRLKGGSEEDFLDIIPAIISTLLPALTIPAIAEPPPEKPATTEPQKQEPKPELKKEPRPEPVKKSELQKAKKPESAAEKYSHAGKFMLALNGFSTLTQWGPGGQLFFGYGVTKWVDVGLSLAF